MRRDAQLTTVIIPRTRDLGDGFEVRRALPSSQCQMVGPFVFFDQMGPVALRAGTGLDVRPHPHIGLATVTYLFDGEILHRDSLGTVQAIRPGEVNWMTAGCGIVHSERTPPELRAAGGSRLFGIQTWVALPKDREETAPTFAHHGATALPVIEGEGKRVRLIVGSLYGAQSPVEVFSEMVYADAALSQAAQLELPAGHEERAIYVAEGRVELAGNVFDASRRGVGGRPDRRGRPPCRPAPQTRRVRAHVSAARGKCGSTRQLKPRTPPLDFTVKPDWQPSPVPDRLQFRRREFASLQKALPRQRVASL